MEIRVKCTVDEASTDVELGCKKEMKIYAIYALPCKRKHH
jgi:hypothetical protein